MGAHASGPRIPPPEEGIQVNFCKNPLCANFGIPPSIDRQPRGKRVGTSRPRDTYVRNKKRGVPTIFCKLCERTSSLKSNHAVIEEQRRLEADRKLPRLNDRCPNVACSNKKPVDEYPFDAYQRFGTTEKGSERFRCKTCMKTFSIPHPPVTLLPHARQKVHGYKNIEIFKELVNKVPLNRICKLRELPFKLLIDRIRFIYRQCRYFNAERESRLKDMPIDDLYLSVDRQVYNVNWSHSADRRNTALMAIGSAERYSGYVFGLHLNFDPSLSARQTNSTAVENGDTQLPVPFRRFARVWLLSDYADRDLDDDENLDPEALETPMSQDDLIVDTSDSPSTEKKLPDKGVQVRAEYTMYGHFLYIKSLLPKVRRYVYYMDDESGIDAVLLSTYINEVRDKRCEGFVVKINKELTVNQRRAEKRKADKLLEEFIEKNPQYSELSHRSLQQVFIEEIIKDNMRGGILVNKTIDYPFPIMSEPEKRVRWLTDLHDRSLDETEIATLYRRATLHPIDRFFMQVRRGVSSLERSLFTASNAGRVWHAYAPYNPERIVWLLEIYRTAYNYVFVGKDKKTPAMRLGLAKGPVKYEDILYFVPGME